MLFWVLIWRLSFLSRMRMFNFFWCFFVVVLGFWFIVLDFWFIIFMFYFLLIMMDCLIMLRWFVSGFLSIVRKFKSVRNGMLSFVSLCLWEVFFVVVDLLRSLVVLVLVFFLRVRLRWSWVLILVSRNRNWILRFLLMRIVSLLFFLLLRSGRWRLLLL